MSMDEIHYGCSFCGEIVSSSHGSSELDPCSIVLTAGFDRPESEQKHQRFFCHFECIKKAFNFENSLPLDDELKQEMGALL